MTTTLAQVLEFCGAATQSDRVAILSALEPNRIFPDSYIVSHPAPPTRSERAAETLASINEGDTVVFPYDGVQYTGEVMKINHKTARIKITKIQGVPRNRITVGMEIRVSASILARSL